MKVDAKGKVKIPDLSEETYDDLEMTVTVEEESDAKRALKEAVRVKGAPLIRNACLVFVKELKVRRLPSATPFGPHACGAHTRLPHRTTTTTAPLPRRCRAAAVPLPPSSRARWLHAARRLRARAAHAAPRTPRHARLASLRLALRQRAVRCRRAWARARR